jgi:hypothetical protein
MEASTAGAPQPHLDVGLTMNKKRMVIAISILFSAWIVLFVGLYVWNFGVPRGAAILPFILASDDGPTMHSPSGDVSLKVYFNDAGAAHSGHFWTWVVRNNRVIAEGYSAPSVRYSHVSFPLEWCDGDSFKVTFKTDRYGDAKDLVTVQLKKDDQHHNPELPPAADASDEA